MAALYTVKMVRLHVVSKYDDKGRLVAETKEEIPIVFHDLPAATANAYAAKFPDAKVEIIEQNGFVDHDARRSFGGVAAKRRPRERRVADAPPTAPKSSTHSAAVTGDMAAAINEELKERT